MGYLDVFASPDVLKLGFRFKQDVVYLSSTFCRLGCDPGFDRVGLEPYIDVAAIHGYLQPKRLGRRKDSKSLASVCEELLGSCNVAIGLIILLLRSIKNMLQEMHCSLSS
ncbi:hypothetical protein MLD38_002954 [Melastoma candidum]|uniref:Uncharacterized protein n=1 Tax=Melastoma candidum TaxID=119954 RepID=A0ACB9S146_9MYRT|nr:hypothetical protein MLD38_002954 [Melastoma candidum]